VPTVYRVLRYEGTQEWLDRQRATEQTRGVADDTVLIVRRNPICQIESHYLSDDEAQVLNVFSLFPILPPPAKPQP
jgi:hypothetical protein